MTIEMTSLSGTSGTGQGIGGEIHLPFGEMWDWLWAT